MSFCRSPSNDALPPRQDSRHYKPCAGTDHRASPQQWVNSGCGGYPFDIGVDAVSQSRIVLRGEKVGRRSDHLVNEPVPPGISTMTTRGERGNFIKVIERPGIFKLCEAVIKCCIAPDGNFRVPEAIHNNYRLNRNRIQRLISFSLS